MSSRTRYSRQQRRKLRHPKVVQAIRERKAALPWHRARAAVAAMVDRGDLPQGCGRVVDAMARCHEEHGSKVRDLELLIGYGLRGDPRRLEARTRARGEPPRFDGIAEEAGLSRRYVIWCVALLVGLGVLRKWCGGPNTDYRRNVNPSVLQRPNGAGERRECQQAIGGSGWANAYTVEGIPDPVRDDPPAEPPEQPRRPEPAPAHAREHIARMRESLERDRLERQRRRLRQEEEQRTGADPARGP